MHRRTGLLAGALALIAPATEAQLIFQDGFEAGTTVPWSATVGTLQPIAWCTPPVSLVDTSTATVVGNGTAASCTEAALNAALASNNGQIRFDCGPLAHTITVTSEKTISGDLVIDGGGLVALRGSGSTRILAHRVPFGTSPLPTLTIQRLALVGGSTAHLSGGTTANGGAAIYKDQGSHLTVIDSAFADNVCPTVGQDVAGGAIYAFGNGVTTIVGSTFGNNRCSSGGAIGALAALPSVQSHLVLVSSLVDGNQATGTGGNPGNGGNGGGMYFDGANQNVTICGSSISDNSANARGAGLFRVSNNGVGGMSIDRTRVLDNFSPAGPDSQAGGLYLQGLQTTISASTIARNTASHTAGVFVATNPGTQTLNVTNSTIAENHARSGLGAGMSVAGTIGGTLHHVTIARNSNEGEFSFASAIAGGNALVIRNSIVADNMKVFMWEDVSCNVARASGGGNIQWPAVNAGSEPETICAPRHGNAFSNPSIGALVDLGGPTPVIVPTAPLADVLNSNCLPTDQLGQSRGTTCSPGSVELP